MSNTYATRTFPTYFRHSSQGDSVSFKNCADFIRFVRCSTVDLQLTPLVVDFGVQSANVDGPPFELRKMLGTSSGFPAIANRRHCWLCQNIPSRLSKTTCTVLGKRKIGRPACQANRPPRGGAENGTRTRRGPFHPCEPPP